MIEYLYLNKAAIRNQDNCLKLHLMPISNDRVRRNLAYSLGLEFYKLRKLTRIHVVFYSNIKMRVLDDKKKLYMVMHLIIIYSTVTLINATWRLLNTNPLYLHQAQI